MSGTWTIEGHRPHGNFSILTTTELEGYQRQVAVVEAEDDAHRIIRDHNSHDKLVEALVWAIPLIAGVENEMTGGLADDLYAEWRQHLDEARAALEEAKA